MWHFFTNLHLLSHHINAWQQVLVQSVTLFSSSPAVAISERKNHTAGKHYICIVENADISSHGRTILVFQQHQLQFVDFTLQWSRFILQSASDTQLPGWQNITVQLAPFQCIAPLAANNLWSGLSSASSVTSSTLRLLDDRSFFIVASQELWGCPAGLFQSLWGTAVRILLASADSSILTKWL